MYVQLSPSLGLDVMQKNTSEKNWVACKSYMIVRPENKRVGSWFVLPTWHTKLMQYVTKRLGMQTPSPTHAGTSLMIVL